MTLAFVGENGLATLPCCSTATAHADVSRLNSAYRERESSGLAFIEGWYGPSESLPDGRGHASHRPTRVEVVYEPLPRTERARRERLLGGCKVAGSWPQRPLSDSAALIFSNPSDALEWYSPPDTTLSSLFGGDPVPYDFEFAELSELTLRSQVVIMAHIGGWGNVPVEQADDILPTIRGIREHLRARGISSVLVPFYRTRGGFLGKLLTMGELFELHHSDADRLSREINRFLSRHPRQRIVMVGLSNGAAFADEVMQRLPDTAQNRVCAIEVGPPFLSPSDADESVLRLSNHDLDPVVTGDYWILMRVRAEGLFRGVYTWMTGRERRKARALVAEHEYSWPVVRQEVVSFLDRWLGR